ncbi:MarR family winged helix-turn-helix transcriptional regulator [Streptomyces sp. GQFP]|uniref:MarR family winged helix-turn-helix transcriptional regulator n=1 Tax=Streptomyces sp. GQFP TaxID=2907545 RepID=UPI001F223553|nr:MarR family transcriptional regulator [Streptomyces sp. GQFP]UIX31954.1 MarR family transcriptional regulator [Streptomyces sp. GQFP]
MDRTDGHADADAMKAAPRCLAGDERDAWISLAGVLLKLPAALDTRLQREAGLSHFEYLVLAGLSESPGETLRMSDLAVLARASLSRLSHVVKRLEQRGWVRREICSQDARCTNAILTDEGQAKMAASTPGYVETVRDLVIDALTPTQLRQLHAITEEILGRIEPDGGCANTRP